MTTEVSAYPAIYRHSVFWLSLGTLTSLAMALGGAAELIHTAFFDQSQTDLQRLIVGAFCIADVVLGSILLLALWKSHLILYEDAIEDHGLFRATRLLRSEIAGKMTLRLYGPTIFLYPIPLDRKKIKIELAALTPDAALKTWLSSVPPLERGYFRNRRLKKRSSIRARGKI